MQIKYNKSFIKEFKIKDENNNRICLQDGQKLIFKVVLPKSVRKRVLPKP